MFSGSEFEEFSLPNYIKVATECDRNKKISQMRTKKEEGFPVKKS